jgi:multiple antibiotic resistance protein
MINLFISLSIKLFFLLTPFFVLTVFLSMTEHMTKAEQRKVAIRTTMAVMVISLILYFAGNPIFSTLGITLDGFRIGAGSLLFLSAVSLVSGKRSSQEAAPDVDFAVVPLAIPITVGPATIGTLLILGAERAVGAGALVCSCLCVGILLRSARPLKKLLGSVGLSVMTKITGLVLSAMAAQIVFTGIRNFLA